MHTNTHRGFTLVELIIVIAIIGLLAAALFVAVDPARRIGEAQDAQRWADITSVLDAVLSYIVDVQTIPGSISGMTANEYYAIGSSSTGCSELDGRSLTGVEIRPNIVDKYLATLPVDPQNDASTSTGYYIKKTSNNRILIGSCIRSGYGTGSIEVQR